MQSYPVGRGLTHLFVVYNQVQIEPQKRRDTGWRPERT